MTTITKRRKIAAVEHVYYIEIALPATQLSERGLSSSRHERAHYGPEDDNDSDDITFSIVVCALPPQRAANMRLLNRSINRRTHAH